MAYDSHRQVVVVQGGGWATAPFYNSWEWDGRRWTERITASRPPLPVHRSTVFDSWPRSRAKITTHVNSDVQQTSPGTLSGL